MVRNYLGDIAAALKQYGQSKGYSLTDEYYFDLAWGGLIGNPDDPNTLFRRTYGNDEATRNRIINRINAEATRSNTNGQRPQGAKACP